MKTKISPLLTPTYQHVPHISTSKLILYLNHQQPHQIEVVGSENIYKWCFKIKYIKQKIFEECCLITLPIFFLQTHGLDDILSFLFYHINNLLCLWVIHCGRTPISIICTFILLEYKIYNTMGNTWVGTKASPWCIQSSLDVEIFENFQLSLHFYTLLMLNIDKWFILWPQYSEST